MISVREQLAFLASHGKEALVAFQRAACANLPDLPGTCARWPACREHDPGTLGCDFPTCCDERAAPAAPQGGQDG